MQCAAVKTTRGAISVPVQVTGDASSGSPQRGEIGTIAPTAVEPSSGTPPVIAFRSTAKMGSADTPHALAAMKHIMAAERGRDGALTPARGGTGDGARTHSFAKSPCGSPEGWPWASQ